MPFGRLHEEAAGDGKLLALSDPAWRMWGMGLVYCQRNLTDGWIPESAIASFGVHAPNPKKIADEICTPQLPGRPALWARVDGGYQVHDYLDWNDSREEILKGRAGARSRMKQYRDRATRDAAHSASPHGEPTPHERRTSPVTERVTEREQPGEQHTQPVGVSCVRGSGSLGKGSGENPAPPANPTTAQLRAMPRLVEGPHLHHALCGRICMHARQFRSFVSKIGGAEADAEARLTAWFDAVNARYEGKTVPCGDEFKFWNHEYDAAFGTPLVAVTSGRTGAAEAGKYAGLTRGL